MALQRSFDFAGIHVANGYLRVVQLNGDKNRIAFVLAYQSAQGQDAIKHESFDFVPNLSGSNFIQQAYEFLKALPGFESATDC